MSSKINFRPEIDGLRMIAVLSVVFFHGFPEFFPGGFIGVDIFFVISGYLISKNIMSSLDEGKFSLFDFFERRIKRIYPSLIIVMSAVTFFGYFLLLSDEYAQLSKHIAGGTIFIPNFMFVKESGYFDNISETKPMLHLWSLAVEEQFYIFFPLTLVFFTKRNFSKIKVISFILISSLMINIYNVDLRPTKNFYWPIGRFWEILIGSAIAWFDLYKKETFNSLRQKIEKFLFKNTKIENLLNNILSTVGAFLIIFAIFKLDKKDSFPGTLALLPTIGAALIILVGNKSWINKKILANPIALFIGLISYPLYLWHWPLLSFLHVIKRSTPELEPRFYAISISFILAFLTFKFIENPIRHNKERKFSTIPLTATMALIGLLSFSIYKKNGLSIRPISQLSTIQTEFKSIGFKTQMIKECGLDIEIAKKIATCIKDKRSGVRYAMIGDSKASALIPGTVRTSLKNKRWLIVGGNNGHGAPSPFISKKQRFEKFQPLILPAIESVIKNKEIEVVTLVGALRNFVIGDLSKNWLDLKNIESKNYTEGKNALRNTVLKLINANKKVVIVVDNPALGDSKSCGERVTKIPLIGKYKLNNEDDDCALPIKELISLRQNYMDNLHSLQKEFPKDVKIFDTLEIFCDQKSGFCKRKNKNINVFSYTDHISDKMSELIGTELNLFIKSWLDENNKNHQKNISKI